MGYSKNNKAYEQNSKETFKQHDITNEQQTWKLNSVHG